MSPPGIEGDDLTLGVADYACIMESEDPVACIQLSVHRGSQLVREHEDFLKFFMEFMSIGARKPEVRKVMTENYRNAINNFKKLLDECMDSGRFKTHDSLKTARAVFFISMGIFFTYFSVDADFDLAEQHIYDMDQLLMGLNIQ